MARDKQGRRKALEKHEVAMVPIRISNFRQKWAILSGILFHVAPTVLQAVSQDTVEQSDTSPCWQLDTGRGVLPSDGIHNLC